MPREGARSPVSIGQRSRVRTRDALDRVHVVLGRGPGKRGGDSRPDSTRPRSLAALGRCRPRASHRRDGLGPERRVGRVGSALVVVYADQRGCRRRDLAQFVAGWGYGRVLGQSERELGHLCPTRWRAERDAHRQRSGARRGGAGVLARRIADRVSRVRRGRRDFRRGRDRRIRPAPHRYRFRAVLVARRTADRIHHRGDHESGEPPGREHSASGARRGRHAATRSSRGTRSRGPGRPPDNVSRTGAPSADNGTSTPLPRPAGRPWR